MGIVLTVAKTDLAPNLHQMKYLSFFAIAIIVSFSACNNAGKSGAVSVPAAPASLQDLAKNINGKNYKTIKLGILSPFAMDSVNPVNWNVEKEDTSQFFRDYAKKQLAFSLSFLKDSSCSFFDADQQKSIPAKYSLDNDPKLGSDEEKPGIKLRVKYEDSLDFGGTKTAAKMTLSYLVRGLAEKEIILETGRSYNNRKLVVWMKAD